MFDGTLHELIEVNYTIMIGNVTPGDKSPGNLLNFRYGSCNKGGVFSEPGISFTI